MRGIITLCGSTKYKQYFEDANRELTMAEWIVLTVGSFHHSEEHEPTKIKIQHFKDKLDKLHKEKIALSRCILVLDIDGYIGPSTESEIMHAKNLGLEVYHYSKGDLGKLVGQ